MELIRQLFVNNPVPVSIQTVHATLAGFDRKYHNDFEHCAAD